LQDNKDDSILWKAYPRVRCSRQLCATACDGSFDPPVLTMKAGTTVTWVNNDDIPHLVSEKDGKFRSSALDTGDKFSQTFSTAGTVEYFCAIHPHMTGKIVVEP